MKKKRLSFYFITLTLFCQIYLCCATPVSAISAEKSAAIAENCATIQSSLKNLQYSDSRARVYLGGRFELVINNYLKPLNRRLVENDIINISLTESQTNFVSLKSTFAADFVTYQQSLEDLIATDCKADPTQFYEKLETARTKRQAVAVDVANLKFALSNHLKLINQLEESL